MRDDLDWSDVEADAANDPTLPWNMRTQELVREFAQLKVWFAVYETAGPTVAGNAKHARLKDIVDEMRKRAVLD